MLSYGSGVTGTSSHLAAELFKSMAGVDIVRVPYRGGGLAMADLMSGKLQLMFTSAGSVMPHVKSGRVRALAVASAEPTPLAPGLPTVAETLTGYEAAQFIGIFAPAKTSTTIIDRLNKEIIRFLNTNSTKARLLDAGLEAVASTPEALAGKVVLEMTRLRKVIDDAGLRAA
jgi:tripartite-type tricarboxylate transporter receptor subunit TctC